MQKQGNAFSSDGGGGVREKPVEGTHEAKTYSEKMADFISDLNFGDIPGDVVEKTKQLVLDTLGVGLAAVDENFTKDILDVAKGMGGTAESSVWGKSVKLPAANAALVNGTMAHGLDFDDMHRAASSHMSVVVVPTALAVSEQKPVSGRAIIAAIVAGYEIGARIGLAAMGKLLLRGWHPTAVFGTFSAATVAAKLMGLKPRQTALAMGIAGSQASGLAQWIEEGSWTKRMHPGWAAHSGIIASLLARTGYDAPRKIFEGGQGLYRAFLRDGNYSLEKLTDQLGKRWETRQICIKMYPAGY
jgi:2-methylcitrate dehydratase PrpD